LGRVVLRGPLPPVPEIAQTQVVSKTWSEGAGKSHHPKFAQLWPRSFRGVLSKGIAGERAANVHLIRGHVQQLEGTERSKEPVPRIEVVIDSPNVIIRSQRGANG